MQTLGSGKKLHTLVIAKTCTDSVVLNVDDKSVENPITDVIVDDLKKVKEFVVFEIEKIESKLFKIMFHREPKS
jgi:hypothetical protein